MQETPQQYIRRMLRYQRGKETFAVLSSSPVRIAGLLKGASARQLNFRPTSSNWSVAEILAHMADAELVYGFRLRLILGSNRTPIQAFDQDTWADSSNYVKQDPKLSVSAFRILRERNLRLLKTLPARMWKHYGIHSERGKETVDRMTRMLAGHDINHVTQIEKILRTRGR